jgi:hypothetical protein
VVNLPASLKEDDGTPLVLVYLVLSSGLVFVSVVDPDPDPGSGAFLTPGSRSGIRDEQPRSHFLELRNHFLGLKYLNSFTRIRDPGWKNSDPGWKNSDPGSGINIPNPQHLFL